MGCGRFLARWGFEVLVAVIQARPDNELGCENQDMDPQWLKTTGCAVPTGVAEQTELPRPRGAEVMLTLQASPPRSRGGRGEDVPVSLCLSLH